MVVEGLPTIKSSSVNVGGGIIVRVIVEAVTVDSDTTVTVAVPDSCPVAIAVIVCEPSGTFVRV